MLINIRDDDTNFFTSVSDLKKAYGTYLGTVPITLACTPFVSEHSFIMEQIPGTRVEQFKKLELLEKNMSSKEIAEMNKLFPFGDNINLVDFLSPLVKTGHVEIALHGHTHRFYPDGAEFIKNHVNFYNIRDGKLYFERLFNCDVSFFVPPSNKINTKAWNFLHQLDLNLLTSGVIDCDSTSEFISVYSRMLVNNPKLINGLVNKKINSNLIKMGENSILRSKTFRLDDSPETFLKRNKQDIEKNKFISIATHYTTLSTDSEYNNRFFTMLELLKTKYSDYEFVTADTLVKRMLS